MDRRKLEKEVFKKHGITPESVSGLSETAGSFLSGYTVMPTRVKLLSRKYGEKIIKALNADRNWVEPNVEKPKYSEYPEKPYSEEQQTALIMAAAAKGDPEHILQIAEENNPVIKSQKDMLAAAVHNDPKLVSLFAKKAEQPYAAKNPNKLISAVKELRKEKVATRHMDDILQLLLFLRHPTGEKILAIKRLGEIAKEEYED